MIRKIFKMTDCKVPIIGVGGILTADDAWEKIKAGAGPNTIRLSIGIETAKDIIEDLDSALK